MALPQFLPIPDAAKQLGLTETELRARVKAGKIAAGVLPDGEIIVNTDITDLPTEDINSRLREIRREDFAHLRGKAITVSEAAEKYGRKFGVNIVRQTIGVWVRQGYVNVISPGYGMELDEADVAYCATVHATRKKAGIHAGVPLLDNNGYPYELKHEALSRYRREKRLHLQA